MKKSVEIPIQWLNPMVKAKATNEVKASIIKIGLQHPIVIMPTTKKDWLKEKEEKYNFILPPPDINSGRFYQIRFGHNRVEAYKELGYEVIPAIICDTAEEAATIGKRQALWMKQKIGPL